MRIINVEEYKKVYPHCPDTFPDELLSEKHSLTVFGMSLSNMNNRGGMTPGQIILNIDREFNSLLITGEKEAIDRISRIKKEYDLSKLQ